MCGVFCVEEAPADFSKKKNGDTVEPERRNK